MQWAADEINHGQWERTAAIVCYIANANRDKDTRPFIPWDFYHRPGQKRPRVESGNRLTADVLRTIGPIVAGGGRG